MKGYKLIDKMLIDKWSRRIISFPLKYGKWENENLMLLENGNKLLNGVKAIEAAVYQIIIKY